MADESIYDIDVAATRLYGKREIDEHLTYHKLMCDENGYLFVNTGGGGMKNTMVIAHPYLPELNDVIIDGVVFQSAQKITKIGIYAQEAPDTTAFKVDITKNQVALGKEATLSAGSQKEITDISDETFNTTDEFGLKITQVGADDTPNYVKIVVYHEFTT